MCTWRGAQRLNLLRRSISAVQFEMPLQWGKRKIVRPVLGVRGEKKETVFIACCFCSSI